MKKFGAMARQALFLLALASGPAAAAEALEGLALLRAHIDTLDLHVAIQPGNADAGLRSIVLHNGELLIEPHIFMLRDGERVMTTGDARIGSGDALLLGAVLERHGFFAKAGKYYAELSAAPATPPPPNASKGVLPVLQGTGVSVYTNVYDADWHTTYQASFDRDAGMRLLGELAAVASGEAKALLEELLAQMEGRPF